jgi:hypothetical protein
MVNIDPAKWSRDQADDNWLDGARRLFPAFAVLDFTMDNTAALAADVELAIEGLQRVKAVLADPAQAQHDAMRRAYDLFTLIRMRQRRNRPEASPRRGGRRQHEFGSAGKPAMAEKS